MKANVLENVYISAPGNMYQTLQKNIKNKIPERKTQIMYGMEYNSGLKY